MIAVGGDRCNLLLRRLPFGQHLGLHFRQLLFEQVAGLHRIITLELQFGKMSAEQVYRLVEVITYIVELCLRMRTRRIQLKLEKRPEHDPGPTRYDLRSFECLVSASVVPELGPQKLIDRAFPVRAAVTER